MIRLLILATVTGAVMTGVSIETPRTEPLQTNTAELDIFIAGKATTYATVAGHLKTYADASETDFNAGTPKFDIRAGTWVGSTGTCFPTGESEIESFDMAMAAREIWGMALNGYIESDVSQQALVRTSLLEFAATEGFSSGTLSGGNECILELSESVWNLVNSAWLLEDAGYSGWSTADRQTLVDWLIDKPLYLASWSAENRKQNWGAVALPALLAIAEYSRGYASTLTLHDASTFSPSAYVDELANVTGPTLWDTTTPLDSDDGDRCADSTPGPAYVYGVQSHGGHPDDLRRTAVPSVDRANCAQTTIDYDCGDPVSADGCLLGQRYQLKYSSGVVAFCEGLRRIGDGGACFDNTSHGGSNGMVYDMIDFATGGDGLFNDFHVINYRMAQMPIAGEYYQDCNLVETEVETGTSASQVTRGGTDLEFGMITHAPLVAYATSACP